MPRIYTQEERDEAIEACLILGTPGNDVEWPTDIVEEPSAMLAVDAFFEIKFDGGDSELEWLLAAELLESGWSLGDEIESW